MNNYQMGTLLVVAPTDEEKLLGIVSKGDVFKAYQIADQEKDAIEY